MQRRGGRNPGDSDGDDSDNGRGGNGPQKGPSRKPSSLNNSRKNPFNNISEGVDVSTSKTPPEPQFDTKLKIDAIPTWDGNPENLRHWLLKLTVYQSGPQ